MLLDVFYLLVGFWFVSEIALILKTRSPSKSSDRGPVEAIWVVMAASALAALASQYLEVLRLPLSPTARWLTADLLVLLGLLVRRAAILTLGRFFSVDVAIQDGHRLVEEGLYRWVRHPAYSGLLVSFLGLGFAFGSWLSLALATIPPATVLLGRIRAEEAVLAQELGEPYRAHCAATKRLIPGLY